MNLSLVDPFVLAQEYPDTLTEKLSMQCLLSFRTLSMLQTDYVQAAVMQPVFVSITLATT